MSDSSKTPAAPGKSGLSREATIKLNSLRKHGQVVETDGGKPVLGPGQTHVFDKSSGILSEVRKSFFKR